MITANLPSIEELEKLYTNFQACEELSISPIMASHVNEIPSYKEIININTVDNLHEVPSSLDKLMAMEGLEKVKEAVMRQISFSAIMDLRKQQGYNVPKRIFNIILTGDPGTGKTTVARLLGQIFHEHGIISKGHMVEINRAGLVGRYIGESESITSAKIEEAKGGILFIDEIYSLTQEARDGESGSRDFGLKVIDTLMPVLSDNNSDLIVIGAGYKDQMQHFLKANPGLASRFPLILDFENLNLDQLYKITTGILKKYDFSISEKGSEKLRSVIAMAMRVKDFGNGRFATSLAENFIMPNVCARVYNNLEEAMKSSDYMESLSTVNDCDIPSIEELFPLKPKERAQMGFNK